MNKKIILTIIIIIAAILIGFVGFVLTGKTPPEKKMFTIGIARWNSDLTYSGNVEGFKEGLAEMGYVEGENVKFIIKTPESDLKIQRQIIQSFIDAKVDLIFSITTPGTLVAKEMTSEIPIVFSVCTFPVESNIVESLESSGNNLVGTRNYITVERQYYQFEKIYAGTKVLAFVHRKGEPNSDAQYLEMKALLKEKGAEVIDIGAVDLEDMRAQLESVIEGVDSIFLACDTLINVGGDEVAIEISKKHKKPCFAGLKGSIPKGALVGNVADFRAIGKMSGIKAGLILNGANPSSLLTESPAEDYVIINTKTAKEIGIEIPQYVLDDAEEIVSE
ncbi:MAG TPA: ABC transporter substrate-binding protein [Desulfobacterales bacterium]|nr:ABC transporter substrate-binding protein [Desulfobacterales bacterium]